MNKFFSRKFIINAVLVIIATFAMFFDYCVFKEWAVFASVVFGYYGYVNLKDKKPE